MSQLAKEKGKSNKWVWFTTVGGEKTLSLAIPYKNNAERGEVQSLAHFAAQHIGEKEAESLAEQFNEGFWSADYKILAYRSDLSPKSEEGKKK